MSVELPETARVIATGERLCLRTWTAGDVAAIAQVWCDAETMRHVGVLEPGQVPEALSRGMAAFRRHGVCFWALDVGGEVVGDCGFHHLDDGRLELGYHLRRDHWGRGLATEAARLALGHAFAVLGATRIVAWVDASNPASARVLLKCGFVDEGPDPDEDGERRFTLNVLENA